MNGSFDCLTCLVRQSVDAVEKTTCDAAGKAEVLKEILSLLSTLDVLQPPPMLARHVHRRLRAWLRDDDPYRQIKEYSNSFALAMYPLLKEQIRNSRDPWETAIRLAIAGNVIDYGAKNNITPELVQQTIEGALSAPFDGRMVQVLRAAVEKAGRILYITDNAGEIVFDRLLIEELPYQKVTVAVRGNPVINDATMDDAVTAGLPDLVKVIDSGTDIPGTAPDECSPEFQRLFYSADLIISKGQGNYETLSGIDRPIFFLLLAKCPLIAAEVGCEVGTMVLRSTSNAC